MLFEHIAMARETDGPKTRAARQRLAEVARRLVESDADLRDLERRMWAGDKIAQAKLNRALRRMGSGPFWVVVDIKGRYQPEWRTPWAVLPGTTGMPLVAAGIYARIGRQAQAGLSPAQQRFNNVQVVKARDAKDAVEVATAGRFAVSESALTEAKMPRPVKGGFTIVGTARGDNVPIDVLQADIYDNTWAIEKGRGGYLLFHIQSGANAGSFKTAKAVKEALQAAYDIAPPAEWKFSHIKDAPKDKLDKWGMVVSLLRYRPASFRTKGIEPDPKNRRQQLAGIKKDIPGLVKLAWKAIVKSAKEKAKKEVQTAYHQPPADYKYSYKTRDHIKPKAGWPARLDVAGTTTTLWDFDVKYTAHGIERNPEDPDAVDLLNWKSLTKKATTTLKSGFTGPTATYKLAIHIKDADWIKVQGDPLIAVTYNLSLTKA